MMDTFRLPDHLKINDVVPNGRCLLPQCNNPSWFKKITPKTMGLCRRHARQYSRHNRAAIDAAVVSQHQCTVANCDKPFYAKALCQMHYKQQYYNNTQQTKIHNTAIVRWMGQEQTTAKSSMYQKTSCKEDGCNGEAYWVRDICDNCLAKKHGVAVWGAELMKCGAGLYATTDFPEFKRIKESGHGEFNGTTVFKRGDTIAEYFGKRMKRDEYLDFQNRVNTACAEGRMSASEARMRLAYTIMIPARPHCHEVDEYIDTFEQMDCFARYCNAPEIGGRPNAQFVREGNKIVIKATDGIWEGSEILVNYDDGRVRQEPREQQRREKRTSARLRGYKSRAQRGLVK